MRLWLRAAGGDRQRAPAALAGRDQRARAAEAGLVARPFHFTVRRHVKRLTALLLLFTTATTGFAEPAASGAAGDRLVLTWVVPCPLDVPGPYTVSGPKFKELQRDVEAVVAQLGNQTEWWDTGPDTSYESLEIYLGGKRYVLNSWYQLYLDSPKAAVCESFGMAAISAEKQRGVEDGARHRAIVGLFAKIRATLKRDAQ